MEFCDYHTQLVSDMAVIRAGIKYIEERVCKHIDEGEEKGGFRDRLIIMEQAVKELKKAEWIRVLLAGFVGGLISQLTPDVIRLIADMLIK